MIAALLVCVLSLAIVLTACNKKGAINMDNPMVFSALKPGSYEVSYDKEGNVDGLGLLLTFLFEYMIHLYCNKAYQI